MVHLGIALGHNATVAVVADGKVVFCQSEERFNRVKNSYGMPWLTLDHVYRMVGGVERIDSCALFGRFAEAYLERESFCPPRGTELTTGNTLDFASVHAWHCDLPKAVAGAVAWREQRDRAFADPANAALGREFYSRQLGLPSAKLLDMHHHTAHALSTVPFLPPDHDGPLLVFTLDGEGDGLSSTVSRYENGRFTQLSSSPRLYSLGRIYAFVTNILGFKMLEHEYKIMGLAPYTKSEHCEPIIEQLTKILWVSDSGEWRGRFRSRCDLAVALHVLCGYQRFDTIAAALQLYAERMIVRWVAHWIGVTGIGTIACAGGVFMNVKANQKLAELPGLKRMAVVPSCGDESTAIGAAVSASQTLEPATPIRPLDHIYTGVAFDDAAIKRYLGEARAADDFAISEPADIDRAVAELLARNEVVGRCSGPMEFGARALGNRSILAHPSTVTTVEFINQAIKSRDFWMPFAPSILAECVNELVDDPKGAVSPYMMVSASTTPRGRAALGAAIHRADGTARPQRVERAANPGYHALISRFRELTGIGAVLNTSFNLHGDPIVCAPADALDTVRRSGLRFLALGRYLLEKRAAA